MLVVTLLLLAFGLQALLNLPLQLTPDIEQPQISVTSGWRAAAPAEVESVIIEPIETVLKNTPSITDINTNIGRGSGTVTLTFALGTNMQQAMLNVLNSLNQLPPLPLDAFEPVVRAGGGRGGPNAASLLVIPVDGNDLVDLAGEQDIIEDVIEPRLLSIPGVAQVNLASRRPMEMRITFDPYKAASLGISPEQIRTSLVQASDVSAGFAEVGRRQYTVRFAGQYHLQSLPEMIVGYQGARAIYLKDIATVEKRLIDRQGLTMRSGKPSYYITISRNHNANTVDLMDEINRAIDELNQGPLSERGLMIDLSFDSSVHIRNALALVKSNLGLGVALAMAVLWLFMRGWRPLLLVALTIPMSVTVAFLVLQVMERSMNVISLAGIAFSVGLVLDAAIIVQENIIRLRSQGKALAQAVLEGTGQVSGALFASTATSVAIFLPVLSMQGIEGQLFYDLALTLSVAVIASFVTAITLLPLANRYLLNQQPLLDPFVAYWQRLSDQIMGLTASPLKRGVWIGLLLGGSALVSVNLMPKSDFMPRTPVDGFFYALNLPPGGNIDFIEQEIAALLKVRLQPYLTGEAQPAIKDYNFYSQGPGNTGGFMYAADPQRVEELMDVMQNDVLADFPDTQVFLFRGQMINLAGNNGRSVNLNLQGSDIRQLMVAAKAGVEAIGQAMPNTSVQPVPALSMNEPELQLVPDDQRLSQAGLLRGQVANSVRAFTDGLFINEYFDGDERINLILRGTPWHTPEQLAALPLATPLAGVQQLGELVSIKRTVGPSMLLRVGGRRTVSLIIRPPADMSLQVAMEQIEQEVMPKIRPHLHGDAGMQIQGNANQMQAAIADMLVNFVMAIGILFLLCCALFRSLLDSLLVLSVMPLAVAGGVLSLWLLNLVRFQSLDLMTMIGFIILLGLVVNNAILLVDQTRRAERSGLDRASAVAQAIRLRARPVYTSTLTSLVGMLPLMLVPGVGSEIYRGLATVIVGGMAFSAMFTLILLPALLRIGEVPSAAAQPESSPATFSART